MLFLVLAVLFNDVTQLGPAIRTRRWDGSPRLSLVPIKSQEFTAVKWIYSSE